MEKLKELFKKYKEVILYLIFGVLTTVINIVAYAIFAKGLAINEYVSNVIAWIISVLFAFFTNRIYVFESKSDKVLKEGASFIAARLLTLGVDMLSMWIMISLIHMDDLIAKIIANVIVIILNYILSKVFVFKKEK